jgi:hypothetical protein
MIKATAFQSLQPLYAETDEQLEAFRKEMFVIKDPSLVALSKHPIFPDRADYMPSGFFRSTGDSVTKDLGTALDMKDFKELLAKKFAGRSTAEIFEEPAPGPFFEFIHFNENGQHYMIGPKTSEKLARDFADHHGQAEALGGAFYARFMSLKLCFETAQRSGAVRFSGP